VISCAGAGDIEQVSLGVVDLLQVCVVADGLDPETFKGQNEEIAAVGNWIAERAQLSAAVR
jgi:hypothetical protein